MICALWSLKRLQKRRRANTEGHGRRSKWKPTKMENYVICRTSPLSIVPQQEVNRVFQETQGQNLGTFRNDCLHKQHNTLTTTCRRQLKPQQKLERLPQQQSTKKTMYESNTIILCSVHVRDDAFAIHSCHRELLITTVLIQGKVMMQVNCSHVDVFCVLLL